MRDKHCNVNFSFLFLCLLSNHWNTHISFFLLRLTFRSLCSMSNLIVFSFLTDLFRLEVSSHKWRLCSASVTQSQRSFQSPSWLDRWCTSRTDMRSIIAWLLCVFVRQGILRWYCVLNGGIVPCCMAGLLFQDCFCLSLFESPPFFIERHFNLIPGVDFWLIKYRPLIQIYGRVQKRVE